MPVEETVDILVIGAGLSGIYAAWLLSREDRTPVVLEARERIGGRILSPEHQGFCPDLGPSWYWPDIHPRMARLIQALGLTGYRQYEAGAGRFQRSGGQVLTVRGYAMEPASWRLAGGMATLVAKLSGTLPPGTVRLDHPVCRIERTSSGAIVEVGQLEQTPRARFHARKVILALPPRLAAATILFVPDLSHRLAQAMLKIGTWMAGQAKFSALYAEPFWRQRGFSGQAFSERGPLGEIHDGSNNGRGPYGLTGFLGIPAVQRRLPGLTDAMLAQLTDLFGEPASRPAAFFYQDWAREPYTATAYDQPPMTVHPDYHPPDGTIALWDGCVFFAGTETADQHGGYLEGALIAAERAAGQLLA